MHYVFHILLPCIVVHIFGHGGQTAKPVVSPEVLTIFAKNIASALSPGLLSDIQSISSNRTLISAPSVSRRKSSFRESLPQYNIRLRRSEPNIELSNRNRRGQKPTLNLIHERFQGGRSIDTGFDLSNAISDIRAASFNEVINQAPTRYPNQYPPSDFQQKSGDVLAQISNSDTNAYRNYVSERNKLDHTGEFHKTLREEISETAQKLGIFEVNKEEDITLAPVLRLSVRSPAEAYNGAYQNHRGAYAPVYRRTSHQHSARQEANNGENNTDDPGNENAEAPPNAESPDRPNYGDYGFPPPHFPNTFYGAPGYNFSPYGNSDVGSNLTDGPGNYNYHGFGGLGFDPYGRFNRYPNFYGHRPSYFPPDNQGSSYQPEEDQSDNNSTSDDAPGKHPYGYPYGNQGYPFGPEIGFHLHGLSPFKGPFGPVPGVFLDLFKKVSPYPNFHQESFPFFPRAHFRPPYGQFYPNHNFPRPVAPSTTPSEPVSPSETGLESPESVSESILNGDAELISESMQKGVIRNANNNSKSRTDQKQAIKRFVLIGSEGCKD